MAHHKSAKKRIRQEAKRREANRFKKVKMRNQIKALRSATDQEEAQKLLPEVISTIDRVAKSNIIHKNKAANLKGQLTRHVNSLG
ncbi:MAG: 30S ribosomal protein S20 [Bacteroidota bacterium]